MPCGCSEQWMGPDAGPSLDRRHALKARFENRELELWPGEFVDVALRLATETAATVVPEAAVQHGQEGSFVYVVEAGKAELRKVKVGPSTRGEVAVSEGLTPGEVVVTDGQIRLRDGAAVAVKNK